MRRRMKSNNPGGPSTCSSTNIKNANHPNNNADSPSLMAHAIVLSESVLHICSESSVVTTPVAFIHRSLAGLGVPENEFPTPVTVFRVMVVIVVTLVVYYLCLGKQHMQNRKALTKELKTAQSRVRSLQSKLNALDKAEEESQERQKNHEPAIATEGHHRAEHQGNQGDAK